MLGDGGRSNIQGPQYDIDVLFGVYLHGPNVQQHLHVMLPGVLSLEVLAGQVHLSLAASKPRTTAFILFNTFSG